jgi:ferric-dicitrate binding protein FerR (iron transport regulator)
LSRDTIGHAVGVEPTTADQVVTPEDVAAAKAASAAMLDHRFELLEAILLAVAAILTAWSAFQATKWGGVQADNYSRAGAARTESVRASTSAGQLSAVDVDTFTSWLAALGADERAGVDSGLTEDGYAPQPGTESAFLYERFRPEFRAAFDAWLATSPRTNPSAAPTPFAMSEYRVAEAEQAIELEQQAEEVSAVARQANQRGDNYVLMTIMFALVLVLVGIGTKMDTVKARTFLFALATFALLAAAIVVFTFPVEI